MTRSLRILLIVVFAAWHADQASAQVTLVLPDSSQTTPVFVNVLEQATVTLPSAVSFVVTNVSGTTVSTSTTVRVEDIVRQTTTSQIRLSVRANSSLFTPPVAGAQTWSAADVSWTGVAWSGATGSDGSLSSLAFVPIASCTTGGCSTTGLVFRLAPKTTVRRSGTHTLVVTWKIEAL